MLRLNRLTDYAVIILATMSRDAHVVSASTLAEKTGLPRPTVSKILNVLAHHDLITSERGVSGGYRMTHVAQEISVADIIHAIEGPIALTACVDGTDDHCTAESRCLMRGNWNRINRAVADALDAVSLADMVAFGDSFPPGTSPQIRPQAQP